LDAAFKENLKILLESKRVMFYHENVLFLDID